MRDYKALVYSICFSFAKNPFDAEDLTQETFLAACTSIERFDGVHPKAWLARIAANKCRDFLKSPARRVDATADETLDTLADADESVELAAERSFSQETARRLCEQLDEPYRGVAVSYWCDGLSVAEISSRSGAPPKTISTRIYRARDRLRNLIKEVSP